MAAQRLTWVSCFHQQNHVPLWISEPGLLVLGHAALSLSKLLQYPIFFSDQWKTLSKVVGPVILSLQSSHCFSEGSILQLHGTYDFISAVLYFSSSSSVLREQMASQCFGKVCLYCDRASILIRDRIVLLTSGGNKSICLKSK